MVPGSTLRYGSSFWSETLRWRAFRMFPSDAAVIPLPSEETTPPVTKTYFDIGDLQGGFSNLTGSEPFSNTRPSHIGGLPPRGAGPGRASSRRTPLPALSPAGRGRSGFRLCSWLQQDQFRVVLAGRWLDGQLGKRLAWGQAHLFQEPVDGVELQLQPGHRVVHRHHVPRFQLPHHLGRLRGIDRRPAAHGDEQDVG